MSEIKKKMKKKMKECRVCGENSHVVFCPNKWRPLTVYVFVFCFRTLAVNSVSDFSQRGLCCTFLFVQYISHLLEIQALLACSCLSEGSLGWHRQQVALD